MIKHVDMLGMVCPFPVVEAEEQMKWLAPGMNSLTLIAASNGDPSAMGHTERTRYHRISTNWRGTMAN